MPLARVLENRYFAQLHQYYNQPTANDEQLPLWDKDPPVFPLPPVNTSASAPPTLALLTLGLAGIGFARHRLTTKATVPYKVA